MTDAAGQRATGQLITGQLITGQVITGEAVGLDVRPASFLLRAAGALIDAAVYLGGYLVLILAMTLLASPLLADEAVDAAVSVVLLVLALVIAPVTVETLSRGRSLGRLAVGVRVVRADGGAIGVRHALARALVGLLDVYASLGGIAVTCGLLDERSRRLGDMVAGTYAQNERVSRVPVSVFGVPVELVDWARTADVARLPDPLARRIARFLAQAPRLAPGSRERLARTLATEASAFVAPMPASAPELALAGIAVLRREREAAALAGETARLAALAPALRGLPPGFPDRG
ncbi:MAG: RDD family protein [Microbacteriaceae bacterium]